MELCNYLHRYYNDNESEDRDLVKCSVKDVIDRFTSLALVVFEKGLVHPNVMI